MSVEKKEPEIRFKRFSGEWKQHNLGELIDIRSAARVHKEQWTETGVPFFRTSDVVSIYKGQENAKAFISYDVYKELTGKIGKVSSGDLLVTGGGSIGIPFLVPNDNPLYFKDADLLWFKNDQKFDGYFLYTFLFSETFKKYIKSISHIGTIAHYTIEQAKSTPINNCERAEQTAIGNTFQKLDNLINHHQQKHDKLSNIKKAMLEKMFPKQGETVPKIRFKGFSGEWLSNSIGEICGATFGGGTPSTNDKDFWQGEIPWIQSSDIKDGSVTSVTAKKYITKTAVNKSATKLISGNSIAIVTRVGVGKLSLMQGEYATSQDFLSLSDIKIDSQYAVYVIWKQLQIEKEQVQGTSIKGITKDELLGKFISYPKSEKEQTAIGNYFQKLDTLINQHQQQITKLNNIKQACLSKMFV
ncbi:restriction endonuclease subunit S [Vibrio vulnificus]|nr:restriction endonuclease subunit S [Vibrio vulnificus]EME0152454.1 restriction endonuclease subunit S [Vibrio vulnificus]EME0154846.1 restriction endonuclease subunit S [Vibrio vulnificus]EME0909414.1 restriction endonuclease subunit S [Vibrio vulnificus]EME0912183.1 restriction endonuclease subunit S [Vibrio vulnificus]